MSAADPRTRRAERQARICGVECPLPATAKELYTQLQTSLVLAWKGGDLVTPSHEISRLLQLKKSADVGAVTRKQLAAAGSNPKRTHVIVGGDKDEKRRSEHGLFRRRDEALFNFFIVVEQTQTLVLLAYHFDLRLPSGATPPFVRFDLQMSGTDVESDGMRCHLHPGNEGLTVPARC